jgi:hypothetical protein
MSKPFKILAMQRVLKILSDKNRCCKGACARDAKRKPVQPWDEAAVQWCWSGAMQRAVMDVTGREDFWKYIVIVEEISGGRNRIHATEWMGDVNDLLGYEKVMEITRRYVKEGGRPIWVPPVFDDSIGTSGWLKRQSQ